MRFASHVIGIFTTYKKINNYDSIQLHNYLFSVYMGLCKQVTHVSQTGQHLYRSL